MADVIHRTTLEYRQSVHTPDYPVEDWIINPDLSAVRGVQQRYWKLSKGAVVAMTEAEQEAVDAAQIAASKDAQAGTVDRELVAAILETAGHAGKEADVISAYRGKL